MKEDGDFTRNFRPLNANYRPIPHATVGYALHPSGAPITSNIVLKYREVFLLSVLSKLDQLLAQMNKKPLFAKLEDWAKKPRQATPHRTSAE